MTHLGLISRRAMASIGVEASLLFAGWAGLVPEAYAQEAPPPSAEASRIVALVDRAAALIESKGKAAFAEFRKSGSEWKNGSIYLFVNADNGITLFHGALPKLEGTNALGLKDSNGTHFVVEMVNVTKSRGAGWVHYMFPKPGQSQASEKWSYVKAVTVEGTPCFVGAGFYP